MGSGYPLNDKLKLGSGIIVNDARWDRHSCLSVILPAQTEMSEPPSFTLYHYRKFIYHLEYTITIFSLGLILHEMLAGARCLFPQEVRNILVKCLRTNDNRRCSANELCAELQRMIQSA